MGDKTPQNRRPSVTQSKSRSKSKNEFASRSAFINFLYTFRQQPENQCKRQPEIAKLGGEKWRSMSDSEKAPYKISAREVRERQPRIKKPRPKRAGKSTKFTTNKNKKISKRKCSKCGYKHGSPGNYGGSTDSFDKEPQDDDGNTSAASDSRSRSRSKSDSGSTKGESTYNSDSDTTY